jgi:hypothetical protein
MRVPPKASSVMNSKNSCLRSRDTWDRQISMSVIGIVFVWYNTCVADVTSFLFRGECFVSQQEVAVGMLYTH